MKRGGPKAIGEIIASITTQKQWRRGAQVIRWREAWRKAVGPYISKRTEIVGARGKKAMVAVADSVLASELALQKPLIIEKLKELAKGKAPQDLLFQVDPDLPLSEEPDAFPPCLEPKSSGEIEEMVKTLQDDELKESFRKILANCMTEEEEQ